MPSRPGQWLCAFSLLVLGDLAAAGGLNQVIISGQSLAVAYGGVPALNLPPPPNAQMFNGGLHAWQPDQLLPLQEQLTETIASGFAQTLADELTANSCANVAHPLLLSLSARGGTPIEELDYAGGDPHQVYWNAIAQAWWGHQLAPGAHQVSAVFWLQGESNAGSDGAAYTARLRNLRADYERHSYFVTGVQKPMPLFSYQTSSESFVSQPATIAQAQLAASVVDADIHLVSPTYHLPHADDRHLNNQGYRWLGAYFARAYQRVVVEASDWQPLRPLVAISDGHSVELIFHVPVPPLAFDTVAVSNPGNFGFRVRDSAGEVPLGEVSIEGRETVRLFLTRALSGNATVEYAYEGTFGAPAGPQTGQRGNLRDSDPALAAGPAGQWFALHNWSVIFRLGIARQGGF